MELWSYLARAILNAFLNDDFLLVIIHGKPRVGKSSYSAKIMWQVYEWLAWFSDTTQGRIDVLENFMGWKPDLVIDKWLHIRDLIPKHARDVYPKISDRIPVYTWDDGGCWLFSLDWSDPVLREIQRYMNVIGTDMNCLMITTPSPGWILSKLGFMPGARWVKIMKTEGDLYGDVQILRPSKRFARLARIYRPFILPDMKKHRVKTEKQDRFSCKMPDEIYKYYRPIRRYYAEMVKERMKKRMVENLEKQAEDGKVKGRDINKEIAKVSNNVEDMIQI